jgi:phosphate transport system permease protein
MTLPTGIITARVAIQAVPPSIREAARGTRRVTAQVVLHHVLPLALPGVLTGTIIGMARALGEDGAAPDDRHGGSSCRRPARHPRRATALPVRSSCGDSPGARFVEKTSGAILVLLGFLIAMNGTADLAAAPLREAVVA